MEKLANIISLTDGQKKHIKNKILGLLKQDELVDASERALREMDAQLKLTKSGLIDLSINHIEKSREIISVEARDAPYTGQQQQCIIPNIKSIGDALIKFQMYEISKGKLRLSIISAHLYQ